MQKYRKLFFLKQDPSLSSPFHHFSLLKNLNIRNQDPTPPLECGDSVPGVDRGGLRVVIVIVIVIVVVIMVIVIIIVVIKVILKRKVCQGEVCVMVLKEHSYSWGGVGPSPIWRIIDTITIIIIIIIDLFVTVERTKP